MSQQGPRTGKPDHFDEALQIGRPPNITKLFPNSRALIVSGKFIDQAALAKGNSIAMAANGRNSFVIRGVLKAAQRANAALIIEIAKSEGGASAYCAVNYWNIARIVDAACNELALLSRWPFMPTTMESKTMMILKPPKWKSPPCSRPA